MTATMQNPKMRQAEHSVLLRRVLPLLLLLCLVFGVGALVIQHLVGRNTPTVDLDAYRAEMLEALQQREGEYDAQSIVLTGTTPVAAKQLAELLGAELRITTTGSFATLTLPEGVTLLDVCQNDAYLEVLPQMSIDYQASISDLSLEEDTAEEDGERLPSRPQYTVTDGSYTLQTYLDYMNLRNVWATTKGAGVTVAVIDTGIDTDHPEFAGRISEYSYNATEDKIVKDYLLSDGSYDWSLIEDEQGHGTAVAGVIGASMNSDEVVGIAPEVTLLVIKAECDEKGTFLRTSDLVFGLYYAIERDVSVVNMSFGGPGDNPYAEPAQLAADSDIICVAAAGNDATAELTYPAADENVIGVGALGADSWELAEYSNYGENVDLVAPGTTYTTLMDGKYGTKNGTSLACPAAVGAIALLRSQYEYQYTEYREIQELIYASCYDLGDLGCDWYYGYGAIDVSALILEEQGRITFNMMTDELENLEQIFIRNHTLQSIPEPERLYAVFDGWYYDPQCTEEYNWYSDEFSSDLTLYAHWVNEDDGIPFTYVELEDGTIEIRSYTGHRRYITVPDKIDGKIVSSIGTAAFAGQTRLREVILPKQLKYIKGSAFAGCNNLLHIDIPDTVVSIGGEAFSDNVRLSYVAFGSNSQLKSVGAMAFKSCSKLQRFELPATLIEMNGSAFFGATNLTAFSVRAGNAAFSAQDGVLFNSEKTALVCYPAGLRGEYTIPNGVSVIGDYAFAMSRITAVDLDGVQSVKECAFKGSKLQSVVIPDSVTEMGKAAFSNSLDLASVTLGNGLTKISSYAFSDCWSLTSIEIPASISSIDGCAFAGTVSLATLTFAENSQLAKIGLAAFSESGVRSVVFPNTLTAIGDDAFRHCKCLSAVDFSKASNLTTIGAFAFSKTQLKTVTLPASLTVLREGAFADCGALTDIKVAAGNTVYVDLDGVVYNKAITEIVAYPAGNARTSYAIEGTVTAIGENTFHGAGNLNSVSLPEGLQAIRRQAFYKCSGLQFMQIPDSVTQIGAESFALCWSLSSVTLSDNSSLPRISYHAFSDCGL
ncbi:MAG: leucine-rich repeat protein, partial [Clostridia bacterium]|nr:leucine-rich repeat protein [Clostridia bacterium]